MTPPYTCPRCGHETPAKTKMRTHFARKTTCPGVVDPDIILTDQVKEHVLENRIYKVKMGRMLEAKVKSLEIGTTVLCPKYNECFYQKVVEAYLGQSHMKLRGCVTDVTTDSAHAEIKRWADFMKGIGQLITYDMISPRPELHAYMFDESCG